MSISDRNEQPDESSGARSVTCCWHSSHSFSKVGWLLANIGKLAAVEPGGLLLILLRHWSSWRAPDWRTSVQVPPTVRVSWTLFHGRSFGGIQNPTDPCERPYKPSARSSFVVYPTIRLVISAKRDLRPWLNQFAPSPEQGGAKRNEFFSTSLVQKCVF